MSWPIACTKKLAPDFAMIATNHGDTSARSQIISATGRSDHNQRADLSTTQKTIIAGATNMGPSGPLISTPAAIAVHRMAGSIQLTLASSSLRLARYIRGSAPLAATDG